METTTLTLDQLTSQANIQGVLTAPTVVTMDATGGVTESQINVRDCIFQSYLSIPSL